MFSFSLRLYFNSTFPPFPFSKASLYLSSHFLKFMVTFFLSLVVLLNVAPPVYIMLLMWMFSGLLALYSQFLDFCLGKTNSPPSFMKFYWDIGLNRSDDLGWMCKVGKTKSLTTCFEQVAPDSLKCFYLYSFNSLYKQYYNHLFP